MKKILLVLMTALPLIAMSANVAASNSGAEKDRTEVKDAAKKAAKDAEKAAKKAAKDADKAAKKAAKDADKAAKKAAKKAKKDSAHSVPEIDAAGAALALGLLGGIAAIRRERKKSAQK